MNLGSGPAGINGWINYDSGVLPVLSKFPNIRKILCTLGLLPKGYDVAWPKILLLDIRKKLPLDNDSVDYIYCSQVLEHFEKYEAIKILTESLRVLKTGGLVRISVPDIKKMLNHDLTAREVNILWWGYEKDIPPANIIAQISRLFIRDHQWHYDKTSIKQLLKDVGFNNIVFYSFKKGKMPDLNKLELAIHEPHSLYVEANK